MAENIKISLTSFIDFVHKTGTPRITLIRKLKSEYGKDYERVTDFWRLLRNAIIKIHKDELPVSHINHVLQGISNKTKLNNYPSRIDNFKKWRGRKKIKWIGTKKKIWKFDNLTIRVNPELGLNINGENYILKLYFKQKKLSRITSATILHLIDNSSIGSRDNFISGILDLSVGKLITSKNKNENDIEALLRGEASAFTSMWYNV